tara:strand:+ start:11942 stop:12346 length:405 start_codon:yes stop_codon:yes gene_type:complete
MSQRMVSCFIVAYLAICFMSQAIAVESLFTFENNDQQVLFDQLSKTLRCVTCPNQSLADSHAPVAESMREEVRDMVLAGKNADAIQAHFIARYGDYVVYHPPLNHKTWVLWFGPLLLIMVGGGFLTAQLFKSRK